MTTRISPNFRQQILCPQQVSVNTTLTGMDAYKVWTHIVVGTITFTLPAAKKGAGPMYFCEQGAANVIVVQPQSTDLIVGNGVGVPVTLNTVGSFFGVFCEIDGKWSVISASPGVAGAGTVSSVGLADGSATPIYNISGSPVTTAGTLTFTFKTQTANTVLAGPTSGGAAQPAFRALVAADVPSSILPGGFTGFANPSGLIGMTAVNGVATTADRSDSTHAIDPAIAPTWTARHTFTSAGNEMIRFAGVNAPFITWYNPAQSTRIGYIQGITTGGAGGTTELLMAIDGSASTDWLSFVTANIRRGHIDGGGAWTISAPTTGIVLTVTGSGATQAVSINAAAFGQNTVWDTTNANGIYCTWNVSGVAIMDIGSRKQVTGGGTATDGAITVRGANAFALGTNSAERIVIASTGAVTINAPTSGIALSVTAVSAQYAVQITGAGTAGNNFGLIVNAGLNASDAAFRVTNSGATINFLETFGDGHGFIGWNGTANTISFAAAGNVTIAVPSSGTAVSATGVASGVVYQAAPSATGAGVALYDSTALTVAVAITSSGSDFSKIQNDGANLWSIATNNALATLGTPVFQWANNGTPKLTGRGPVAAALVDMTPDKGSFTITYTGMTTVITGTAVWVRKGEQVQLHFPAATGTSNATSFTATGLPTDIQPTRTQILSVPPGGAQNSGSLVASGAGVIVTAASGTATFQLTGSSTGWTASGTKGVLGAFSVAYMLN